MPQCPHCQTPYDKGQRYCSVCGSFLLHAEEGDNFCPQCDVRVSARQEYCHECDAPLKGQAAAAAPIAVPPEAAPAAAPSPVTAPRGMQPWLVGILIGAGVLILILVILLFSRGTAPPPPAVAPKAEAPAPAPPVPAPVAPTPAPPPEPKAEPTRPPGADLKEQLQSVLSTLREAQLQKNIVQFMSVYSLTFPELDQKRSRALKQWGNYDYTNLVYTIDKLQALDPDNTMVWVTWYIDTRNRRTQELASATQIYKVRFVKEMGQWRIRSLEEVEKVGEE